MRFSPGVFFFLALLVFCFPCPNVLKRVAGIQNGIFLKKQYNFSVSTFDVLSLYYIQLTVRFKCFYLHFYAAPQLFFGNRVVLTP